MLKPKFRKLVVKSIVFWNYFMYTYIECSPRTCVSVGMRRSLAFNITCVLERIYLTFDTRGFWTKLCFLKRCK